MCGFAGIVRFDGRAVRSARLSAMADTLTHRGPDDHGFVMLSGEASGCRFNRDPGADEGLFPAGFAHRRLSIIDPGPGGLQPMSIRDGAVWMVYNGEIFNYIELREELERAGRSFGTATDTEVLLTAWDEWGPDCLDRLNGMWAFAIWDTVRRRLFIARDRFGIKPLYIADGGGWFAFASEPKALLALDGVTAEPDGRAVADYLIHGRVDSFRWTFFSSIDRLEPGCCLDIGFDARSLPEQRRWWRLEDTLADPPAGDDECAARYGELFTSSVRLRLRSDVPVGTCLSGGLDSTSVVCVARPWLEPGNQKTFSAVYGNEFDGDETRWIDEVVRFADVENFRITPTGRTLRDDLDRFLRAQDEPFGSTSQYSQYKVFELARASGTTVTLDGQGADEELAGYHYLYPVHVAGLLRRGTFGEAAREFAASRAMTGEGFVPSALAAGAGFLPHRTMIRWANRYDRSRSVRWVRGHVLRHAAALQPPAVPRGFDTLDARLYELFTISSLPALLRYEDRNSMAFSVEARLPFLDHRLVSYIFSLPPRQKIRDGWTKHVMREAMRGVIPETVRTRRDKIGFATPEASWWRGELLGYIREVLGDRRTESRGLYDTDRLTELVDANARGAVNAGRALWRALCLELWFRAYID